MKNLLINFDEMGTKKDAATKTIIREFQKIGVTVAQADVAPVAKRTSGITYREMLLTFSDSQTVTLMVKQSGDIYQIKINGKVIPVKNQDDHKAAIAEVAAKLDSGRTAFQKKLAAAKVPLPPSIRTAAPKMEVALQQKSSALDEAISGVKTEIEAIDKELANG